MLAHYLRAWPTLFGQATLFLATISGVLLIAMMGVLAVDVVMRYGFGAPMLGSNEIVQLLALGVVMGALPYCTQGDGHVRVDVFDGMIGAVGRFIGDVTSRGLAIFAFVVLFRRAVLKALDAAEFGDTTNMLNLPLWPLYAILAAGIGLCALVYVDQLVAIVWRALRGKGSAAA
ncbi:MAG: TRAP transporter small permease [Pseudomonadota bacterium]|nr:TRAP transporter small permease [Pseudomonadota bacterium]